ncbi:MAG: putative metal-binding motif-containing protein, partial [Candidatus Pacearchaeota archaeon]
NDYDAKIESIALSEDGKTAYIKLSGGNQNEIDSIKFIFKSNDSEYIYETKEGISEISYENTNSFLSYFANPEYEGSYDYIINASNIGLDNFKGIIKVEVSIKFKDNKGNIKETNSIASSNKDDIKVVRNGGYSGGGGSSGGGGGSGGSEGSLTCIPKTCVDLGKTCGQFEDGCGSNVNCGLCSCIPSKTCSDYQDICGVNLNNGCGNVLDCRNNCDSLKSCYSGSGVVIPTCIDSVERCNESDGGLMEVIFGITQKINLSKTDFCISPTQLSEYYCFYNSNTKKSEIRNISVSCSNCTNGKCVNEIFITDDWIKQRSPPYYLDQKNFKYILMTDVRTNGTAFLIGSPGQPTSVGNNVSLDLNSHTITYADMDFTGVLNSGFEEGDPINNKIPISWDISNSPHGYRQNYTQKLFFDKFSYRLMDLYGDSYASEYILSSPVYLPEAGNYAVFSQVQGNSNSKVSITIEGIQIYCNNQFSNMGSIYTGTDMSIGIICEFNITNPTTVRAKISIETKTGTNVSANIDEVDIRPIGFSGFADIPWNRIAYEIKNGKIIEGKSKAVYSPAIKIGSNIHDLSLITNGMNSQNIDMYWASGINVYNNYMEANGKLPLHRHYFFSMIEMGRSNGNNKIYNNTLLYGPHVGMNIGGSNSSRNQINDNIIKTRIVATNGFSIATSYADIYNNKIQPYQGHGIGGTTGLKIYNNLIEPRSWPCSEYSSYGYPNSAHGIRLKNYGSGSGGEIEIYNNTIIGKTNSQLENCYTEVVGITDYLTDSNPNIPPNPYDINIHNNYIAMETNNYLQQHAIGIKAMGHSNIYNNTIKSNHVIIELADSDVYNLNNLRRMVSNTLIKPLSGLQGFTTLRNNGYGFSRNNIFIGTNLIDGANLKEINDGRNLDYNVTDYLKINIKDNINNNVDSALIFVYDKLNSTIYIGTTDSKGEIQAEIMNYSYYAPSSARGNYIEKSPYLINVIKTGFIPKNFTLTSFNNMDLLILQIEKESDSCLNNDIDKDGYAQGCLFGNYDCDNNNPNVNPGKEEVCNGIDDNCINGIDEVSVLGTTRCGLGICAHTSYNCINGILTSCNPFEGRLSEICENNIDEDCDGFDSICDTLLTNQNTPDQTNTINGNINLVCEASDIKGIKSIELYNNIGSQYQRKDIKYPNSDYIWLEAEDFFPQSGWKLCGKNISCGDDAPSNRWQINGGASGFKFMLGENALNMTLNKYFDSGTYYVYARSFMRSTGNARKWNLSIDSIQFTKSFNNLNTNRYDWEYAGSITLANGEHKIEIIENSLDSYFDYPDLILFTKDSNFNPGTNCGNNIFNFKNFTDVFNIYSNYNCKKPTTNSLTVTFSLSGIPSGTFIWSCKATNDLGYSKFTNNRTILS